MELVGVSMIELDVSTELVVRTSDEMLEDDNS
jgi:hypothetical protein